MSARARTPLILIASQGMAGSAGKCTHRASWWLRVFARAVGASERSHLVLERWPETKFERLPCAAIAFSSIACGRPVELLGSALRELGARL